MTFIAKMLFAGHCLNNWRYKALFTAFDQHYWTCMFAIRKLISSNESQIWKIYFGGIKQKIKKRHFCTPFQVYLKKKTFYYDLNFVTTVFGNRFSSQRSDLFLCVSLLCQQNTWRAGAACKQLFTLFYEYKNCFLQRRICWWTCPIWKPYLYRISTSVNLI